MKIATVIGVCLQIIKSTAEQNTAIASHRKPITGEFCPATEVKNRSIIKEGYKLVANTLFLILIITLICACSVKEQNNTPPNAEVTKYFDFIKQQIYTYHHKDLQEYIGADPNVFVEYDSSFGKQQKYSPRFYPMDYALSVLGLYFETQDKIFEKTAANQFAYSQKFIDKNGFFVVPIENKLVVTSDSLSRFILSSYIYFKLIGDVNALRIADEQAQKLLQIRGQDGYSPYIFDPNTGMTDLPGEINPNQNASIALAFACLYTDEHSSFYDSAQIKNIIDAELRYATSLVGSNGEVLSAVSEMTYLANYASFTVRNIALATKLMKITVYDKWLINQLKFLSQFEMPDSKISGQHDSGASLDRFIAYSALGIVNRENISTLQRMLPNDTSSVTSAFMRYVAYISILNSKVFEQ